MAADGLFKDSELCNPRRRTLLRVMAAAPSALLMPFSAALAAARPRGLSFHHTHTNEKLTAVYHADGGYLSDSLTEINRFLRDFRTGDVHPIDPQLLDILYAVRASTGSNGVFEVISGFRSPFTNESLRAQGRGVAKKSLHMQGRAIDVRLTDLDTAKLRDVAKQLKLGGVGYYGKSDFVHLDTGRVRSW